MVSASVETTKNARRTNGIRTMTEMAAGQMDDRIRRVIESNANINVDVATLDEHADLYRAGMTSHASVNLMLGLEDEFDLEFPDRLLTRATFESVASIKQGLRQIVAEDAA